MRRQQLLLVFLIGVVGVASFIGVLVWRQESKAIALPANYPLPTVDPNHPHPTPVRSQLSPDRILIKFKAGTKKASEDAAVSAQGLTFKKDLGSLGIGLYTVPSGTDAGTVVQQLNANPEIEYAEQDGIVPQTATTANDPWYAYLKPYAEQMQLPEAWDLTTGSSNVIIAVVDDGVRATHEDLAGQLVTGWNSIDNSTDTAPFQGESHGTLVAGTIVAKGNNSLGVTGVCWQCKVMPIRVTHAAGVAYLSEIADGIRYAADHGARIAIASYRLDMSSKTLNAAIQYFNDKKGVVVTGAGNDSSLLPLADQPNLIVVSGTDGDGNKVSFSNWGPFVDLAAPYYGYSTTADSDSSYRGWAGTSVSAPYVAGVAGLVLSANPNLTAAQLQDVLFKTADDKGDPGRDNLYGWGVVNAFKAVSAAKAEH